MPIMQGWGATAFCVDRSLESFSRAVALPRS